MISFEIEYHNVQKNLKLFGLMLEKMQLKKQVK